MNSRNYLNKPRIKRRKERRKGEFFAIYYTKISLTKNFIYGNISNKIFLKTNK